MARGTESSFILGCWHREHGDSGEHIVLIPLCNTVTHCGIGCSINNVLCMVRGLSSAYRMCSSLSDGLSNGFSGCSRNNSVVIQPVLGVVSHGNENHSWKTSAFWWCWSLDLDQFGHSPCEKAKCFHWLSCGYIISMVNCFNFKKLSLCVLYVHSMVKKQNKINTLK